MALHADDDIVLLAVVLVAAENPDEEPVKKKRKSPTVWQRPWLSHRDIPTCLVGIDIARYNREIDDGYWYYHQNVIDEAMPILAHTINFINRAENVLGPWLTGTIHDFVNNKLYNRYGKLRDGLHPSTQTQEKWAKLFAKSMYTNYTKMYT